MSVRPECEEIMRVRNLLHSEWVREGIAHAQAQYRATAAATMSPAESVNLSYLHAGAPLSAARTAAPTKVQKRVADLRARAAKIANYGGEGHSSISTIELMLNTIVEDFQTDAATLAALVTGNTGGGPPCPSLTRVNAVKVVQRLEETIGELAKVRDMLDAHKSEGQRFSGPGVYQMDSHIGPEPMLTLN